MLEFMMPILDSEKPKRITLTVITTLFGALSGVRPENWGHIIFDNVAQNIPLIRNKPSYLTPSLYISTHNSDAPWWTRTTC